MNSLFHLDLRNVDVVEIGHSGAQVDLLRESYCCRMLVVNSSLAAWVKNFLFSTVLV